MRLAGDVAVLFFVVLFFVVLAVAGAVVLVPARVARRRNTPLGPASWHAAHHAVGEVTTVSVELHQLMSDGSTTVAETRSVGQVANADDDYDDVLGALVLKAKQRAYLLDLRSGD